MPAPTTTAEFLDCLHKSGLVEEAVLEKQLQQVQAARNGAAPPASPQALADELVRAGVLTPFHVSNLLKGRFRGFFIGRYRLLETLGAGGMGQVYLAEHRVMRRLVALKVLPIRPNADPVLMLRFQREARAAAVLDHPNIVHAFDADQDEKVHFLVLEYVEGSSLQELVRRRGPLPVGRAVNYVCQAAHGLHYAHQGGLIHRDVKPGNILVDRAGLVKILDLGLALLSQDEMDSLTVKHNNGLALGTVDYLAPEQAANSHEVDPRADLYALGGTLYYLLTGRVPFQDGTTAEKLIWHRFKKPTAIRGLRPDVPAEVEAIVNRLMAKKPEDRYATAEAALEALAPWAAPLGAPPEGEIPLPCPAVRQLLQPPAIQEARRAASCAALDLPPVLATLPEAGATAVPAVPHRTQRRTGTAVPIVSVSAPSPPKPRKASGVRSLLKPRTSAHAGGGPAPELVETPSLGQHCNIDTEYPDLKTPPHGNPPVESWLPDLTSPPPIPPSRRWWWPLVVAALLVLGSMAGAVWSLTALAGR